MVKPRVFAPPPKPATTAPAPHAEVPPAPLAERPRGLTLSLSGALTGRVARTPTYLSWGLELHAGMYFERFLLVLTLRWDELSHPRSELEADDVGAGFSVARTVTEQPSWALSLGGAAELLMQTQSADVRGSMRPRSVADLRVGVLARVSIGSGPVRGLIIWNVELSPLRLRRSMSIYEQLPSWGTGLAIGCAWESP